MMQTLKTAWSWIDDRTGVMKLLGPPMKHHVPRNAKWWYVFGSCTLLFFTIQIVTGICLALVGACAGTLSLVPGPDFWPALPPLAGMFLGDFVGAQVSGALVARLRLAKHQI